jgi:hypothetical protein
MASPTPKNLMRRVGSKPPTTGDPTPTTWFNTLRIRMHTAESTVGPRSRSGGHTATGQTTPVFHDQPPANPTHNARFAERSKHHNRQSISKCGCRTSCQVGPGGEIDTRKYRDCPTRPRSRELAGTVVRTASPGSRHPRSWPAQRVHPSAVRAVQNGRAEEPAKPSESSTLAHDFSPKE